MPQAPQGIQPLHMHKLPSKRTVAFTLPINPRLLDELEPQDLVDFYHFLRSNEFSGETFLHLRYAWEVIEYRFEQMDEKQLVLFTQGDGYLVYDTEQRLVEYFYAGPDVEQGVVECDFAMWLQLLESWKAAGSSCKK